MTETNPASSPAPPVPGASAPARDPGAGPARRVGHMPELTGLRGVAALWVVALHAIAYHNHVTGVSDHPLALYFARFGWVGVDIFFVLSGFLLALPLLARAGQRMDRGRWHRYLVSRFARIVPPYYGSILLIVILVALQPQLQLDRMDLLRHLGFIHNFWSDSILSLNPVAWTLAIEVQFYLLLPLVVSLFSGRRWIPTLAVALVITLGYRTFAFDFANGAYGQWLALQLPAFSLHFALGIAAARAYLAGWRLPIRGRWAVPLAVVGFGILPNALLLAELLPSELNDRVARLALRPVVAVGATILIYSAVTQASWGARALRNPVLQHTGDISYSLYLLHMPVLAWFAMNAPVVHAWGFPVYLALALVISWAASVAFFQLVERPSLALKALWLGRGGTSSKAPPPVEVKLPASQQARPVADE